MDKKDDNSFTYTSTNINISYDEVFLDFKNWIAEYFWVIEEDKKVW
jgi:hypothetical protein